MGNINNCFRKRDSIELKNKPLCVTGEVVPVINNLTELQDQSIRVHHIHDVLDQIQVKVHKIEDTIDEQIKVLSPKPTKRRL